MTEKSARRANGNRTKQKILDAAEALFGARGFDAVSLRDITESAAVTLALASYHFGTKERLFEAVVARRADVLCKLRRARLAELTAQAAPRDILDAFMSPLFEQIKTGTDEGWAAYLRVLPRLGEDDRWLDLLSEHFDEVAREFIAALRQSCPKTDTERLERAFLMTVQLMLVTVSRQKRLERLTDSRASAADLEAAYDSLLDFVAAGFDALPAGA
jgi:AcrR family transcriptional regulator